MQEPIPVDVIECQTSPPEPGPACRECVGEGMNHALEKTLGLLMDLNDLEYSGEDVPSAIHQLLLGVVDWPPLCAEHHKEVGP